MTTKQQAIEEMAQEMVANDWWNKRPNDIAAILYTALERLGMIRAPGTAEVCEICAAQNDYRAKLCHDADCPIRTAQETKP
jgi:hypothetical protein